MGRILPFADKEKTTGVIPVVHVLAIYTTEPPSAATDFCF